LQSSVLLVASALAKAGDEIILPLPAYFNYSMWLEMTGVEVRHVPFRPEARAYLISAISGLRYVTNEGAGVDLTEQSDRRDLSAGVFGCSVRAVREAGIALVLRRDLFANFLVMRTCRTRVSAARLARDVDFTSTASQRCSVSPDIVSAPSSPMRNSSTKSARKWIASRFVRRISGRSARRSAWSRWTIAARQWREDAGAARGDAPRIRARRPRLQPGEFRRLFRVPQAPAWRTYIVGGCPGAWLSGKHVLALPGSIFGPEQDNYIRMAFANVDASLMDDMPRALAADAAERRRGSL